MSEQNKEALTAFASIMARGRCLDDEFRGTKFADAAVIVRSALETAQQEADIGAWCVANEGTYLVEPSLIGWCAKVSNEIQFQQEERRARPEAIGALAAWCRAELAK